MHQPLDRRAMGVLSLSHTADDINQSFLPAILPALVASAHLSFAAAATLVLAQAISSSVVQPAIGYLADRKPLPWLSVAGVLLAGFGIAAIGFAPSYRWMVACALVSGLGIAAFHPEAARFANFVAGSKKATGMRWFSLGGNLGFALGPVLAAGSLAVFGIHGTLAAAVPVLLMGGALAYELPRLHGFVPAKPAHGQERGENDDWPAFTKLTLFVTLRSMAYIGLVTFTPLFFVHALGTSQLIGNIALSTYLISGAAGTIVGGTDRRSHLAPERFAGVDGRCRDLDRAVRSVRLAGDGRARRHRYRADRLRPDRVADGVRRPGPRISAAAYRRRFGRHAWPRGQPRRHAQPRCWERSAIAMDCMRRCSPARAWRRSRS